MCLPPPPHHELLGSHAERSPFCSLAVDRNGSGILLCGTVVFLCHFLTPKMDPTNPCHLHSQCDVLTEILEWQVYVSRCIQTSIVPDRGRSGCKPPLASIPASVPKCTRVRSVHREAADAHCAARATGASPPCRTLASACPHTHRWPRTGQRAALQDSRFCLSPYSSLTPHRGESCPCSHLSQGPRSPWFSCL